MNISDLSNAERETHLNMTADERGVWRIYSDDPVMQRKLERVGATVVSETAIGKHYELPANQVSFRKPPKPLSEAQRKASAERLARLRAQNLVK